MKDNEVRATGGMPGLEYLIKLLKKIFRRR